VMVGIHSLLWMRSTSRLLLLGPARRCNIASRIERKDKRGAWHLRRTLAIRRTLNGSAMEWLVILSDQSA